jgi:aromatic ring-opening dioxygenase LigB subunit
VGVVFACISPHGSEIIPDLSGDMFEAFAETRKGLEKLAEIIRDKAIETIVLATPHGLRLEATIGVVISEFTEGSLQANGNVVKVRCTCDRELARAILENAKKADLPAVGANYGTSEGPASCMPLDWGALVPLWFLIHRNSNTPKVIIVTPSREIPLQLLTRFGQVIGETAQASRKKVAFVASADQGHAHRADGPYGFNSSSREFDEMVKLAVLESDLRPLLNLPRQFIEDAKPDSVWQIAILQGILERFPMKGQLLSYQIPTYFGMLCAAFQPQK